MEIAALTDEHAVLAVASTMEQRIDATEPIQAALRQIPEHYRQPLLLVIAGYGHQDIAAALGVNVNTVKTRVHRARARFRQAYIA